MNHAPPPTPEAPPELLGHPALDQSAPAIATSSKPAPLGARALKGATWILIQSILAQAMAFGSKVAVANLLTPAEVGVATLALSICSFFTFLQPTALNDILIQRQRHFTRWANSAFWMCASLAALMIIAAMMTAPIVGFYFQSPLIALLVIAGTLPGAIAGLTNVWSAEHSIKFNFRLLALAGSATSICTTVLTVLMAALNAGPWALVVPSTVATLLLLVLYVKTAEFRPHGRPHFRRWRFLLGDSLILSAGAFFANLAMQADNFFIGVYRGDATLGVYALAYSASFQFVQLSSRSLRGVILPAFSSISGDAQRRETAFLNAIRMVALVTMPLCILMIPVSPAAIHFIFSNRSSKWDDAAPLMQIFLSGMAFVVFAGLATSVMQARRKFAMFLATNATVGILFCVMAWLCASLSGPKAVAIGATIIYGVFGILTPLAASSPSSLAAKGRLLTAMLVPFAVASLSALAGDSIARMTPWATMNVRYGTVAGLVGAAVYVILALVFMRSAVKLATERVGAIIRRRSSIQVKPDAV